MTITYIVHVQSVRLVTCVCHFRETSNAPLKKAAIYCPDLYVCLKAICCMSIMLGCLRLKMHQWMHDHHPFKEGGRSKCKLAIRRCFGGGPMKMYAYIFFHRLYCKIAF